MTKTSTLLRRISQFICLILSILFGSTAFSQTLKISDFSIFSTTGVEIGTSTTLNGGGAIGSSGLVSSTGNFLLTGDIHSGTTMNLANKANITGKLTAANSSGAGGNILVVGSNFNFTGNIDVKGDVNIKGGSVTGKVTIPTNAKYVGPTPSLGVTKGTPNIYALPNLPPVSTFPTGTALNIPSGTTIPLSPGIYTDMKLTGGQTVVFSGPGTYVFNSIKNSGTFNYWTFDFQGSPTGDIIIYVINDVDLNKHGVTITGGGDPSRVYMEVHGNGSTSSDGQTAFTMANGGSGSPSSRIVGTLFANNGTVVLGSGTGNSDITGAIFANKKITLQSNVTIQYAPYNFCKGLTADAGQDGEITCDNPTIQLQGSSNTANVQYQWTDPLGSTSFPGSNTNNPTVSVGGTYKLTVTDPTNGCTAIDSVYINSIPCIFGSVLAPPGGKVDENNLIGAELTYKGDNPDVEDTTGQIFTTGSAVDEVYVEILAKEGQYETLLSILQGPTYGLNSIIPNPPGSLLITGKIMSDKLDLLNSLTAYIVYVKSLYPGVQNFGVATTGGDIALRTDFLRDGYGLKGEGIKIGVLSDAFDSRGGASLDISNKDLPGPGNPINSTPVQILYDYPVLPGQTLSDEGRAMIQTMFDIAPNAQYVFRTGYLSPGDFANAITALQGEHCDVIVDDIAYITEPFFRDGVIAQSVNAAKAAGVTYVSSAGNYGDKSYSAVFNPAPPPAGFSGNAHNFGGGQIYQSISFQPGNYTIVLQWDDPVKSLGGNNGVVNDFDFYLTNIGGQPIYGLNRFSTGGDPYEVIFVTVTQATTSNLFVIRASGSDNVRFKYIIFRGNAQITGNSTGTSTIVGQANAEGALAIGAVRYNNTPAVNGGTPVVESFSSIGGTPVNGVVRNKPDFVAPNGGNTSFFGSLGPIADIEGDGLPNFFGTSAAAPHAAAAIGLIIQAKKKYYNQTLTPDQVKALLQSSALDIGAPGFDFSSGNGFIQAGAVVQTFANPTPVAQSLEVPDGITPGETEFEVTLHGQFFDQNAEVLFRGNPIPTTYVNNTTLLADIPIFEGNPAISARNPSISGSTAEIVVSNSISFFDIPKKRIIVTANNQTVHYGSATPAFTSTITVDGQTLEEAGLTAGDLGLASLTYTTPYTPGSVVGVYAINPVVPELDPSNPDQAALLETYSYDAEDFNSGILTVTQLPLEITVENTEATFGSQLTSRFHYKYNYDESQIPLENREAFRNAIITAHQSGIQPNALLLIDSRQTESFGRPLLNTDLLNLSFLVSTQAIGKGLPLLNSDPLGTSDKAVVLNPQLIFNYQENNTNTVLLSGITTTFGRPLLNNIPEIDGQLVLPQETMVGSVPLQNGEAVVNGISMKGLPLLNGLPILNSFGRPLLNGRPILNSEYIGYDNVSKMAVILDEDDVNAPEGTNFDLKTLPAITGYTVGTHFTVPPPFTSGEFSDQFSLTYTPGEITITPQTLELQVNDRHKTYGDNDITGFEYHITGGLVYGDDSADVINGPATYTLLDGSGTPVTGNISAGTYQIRLDAVSMYEPSNYVIHATNGTLTVDKAVLTATADNATRVYGDPNPAFTFTYQGFMGTDDAGAITTSPTGSTTATATSNIGTYPITGSGGFASNYSFIFVNGTLTVTKASLTVKANDTFIFEGDKLPKFTSTYTGFRNNEQTTITSGPSYTLSPTYSGAAGVYNIIPSALSFPKSANYDITYLNGLLYVNPEGQGAKKIRTYLDCVEELTDDPDYPLKAHFSYRNDNATPVYIPVGPDNKLESAGTFSGTPPTVFNPGSGGFEVRFDGTKLTWTVTSYDSNHKTSVGSEASSTSSKCPSGIGSSRLMEGDIQTLNQAATEIKAYPNPAKSRVVITNPQARIQLSDVTVFDTQGKQYIGLPLRKMGDGNLEIDMSRLAGGTYMIRIQQKQEVKILRVIKE